MKSLKQNANALILCLFELVVGVLLMINPVGFTTGIIMAAGAVMMVHGVISIVKYFRMDATSAAASQSMAQGLGMLLVGGFCAFRSEWFVATFPVLTIVYGVMILLTGLSKVQLTVDMLRRKSRHWFLAAMNAAVSIICAVVILKSPFTSTTVLWVFTGASLIVEAVFDVVTLFFGSKDDEVNAA